MITKHHSIVLITVLATACVAPDAEDTSDVSQALFECPGCASNGLTEGQFNLLFGQMDRGALSDRGAWDWARDAPLTLCSASTPGSGCDLRPEWRSWLHTGSASIQGTRTALMTEMVRIVAPKGYAIRDPGGNTYAGDFGLAVKARTESFGYPEQEAVTGGMIALLDPVAGVPVCLLSKRTPGNCTGAAPFFEASFYGNHFRGGFTAIAGGKDAPRPGLNRRYGNVDGSQTTRAIDYPVNGSPTPCSYGGSGAETYATSCPGDNGVVWNEPVSVRLPADPHDWFYANSRADRPPSFPMPY